MRPVTPDIPNGFILLEVLVAMSLILGVWITSIGAYQGLALGLIQQESKQSVLRQAFDAHELAEQLRANRSQKNLPNTSNLSQKGLKNESSRMPSRNRSLRSIAKSSLEN
jgi:Tfp pilus assembly protein PilV